MLREKLSDRFTLDTDLSVDDVVAQLASASGWADDRVLRRIPQLSRYRGRLARMKLQVFGNSDCLHVFGYEKGPLSFLHLQLFFDVEDGFRFAFSNLP